jgi:hypothetical protein
MATGKAISGAAALLYLGDSGKPIGWCTGVTAQETLEYVPIDPIGLIDVAGHEPVRRTVSMSASFVRIKEESLATQEAWSRGDTLSVIDFGPMDAILIDQTTGTAIFKLEGVYPQTRSWQIQKGSIVTVNATFYARTMTDEVG